MAKIRSLTWQSRRRRIVVALASLVVSSTTVASPPATAQGRPGRPAPPDGLPAVPMPMHAPARTLEELVAVQDKLNGRRIVPDHLGRPEARAISDRLLGESSGPFSAAACYPQGTPGYESYCYNPGHILQVPGIATHWGYWPYDGRSTRDVVIVDELGPTRARQWLQEFVRRNNEEQWAPKPTRPKLVYYTSEYLASLGYTQFVGCAANWAQHIEFCPEPSGASYAMWFINGSGHFTQTEARIGSLNGAWMTAEDMNTEFTVLHEAGHVFGGYAHDTDCISVMTYCSTYRGRQYLWFTYYNNGEGNQGKVLVANYDGHLN